jgi:hypothetical protein
MFYGPDGLLGLTGGPGLSTPAEQARNLDTAGKLWAVSEVLTGVIFGA